MEVGGKEGGWLTGILMRVKERGELKKEKTTMGIVSVTYIFRSSSSPPLGLHTCVHVCM